MDLAAAAAAVAADDMDNELKQHAAVLPPTAPHVLGAPQGYLRIDRCLIQLLSQKLAAAPALASSSAAACAMDYC
jgi:hypothetical protein